MPPRLTIGMATYNDFDGCYFTIQALRLYQSILPYPSWLPSPPAAIEGFPRRLSFVECITHGLIEIVIVDNAPGSSHSQMLQGLCANSGAKYFALPNPVGTSPSRNKVFEVATGEFVLCTDSHVLLVPGAIEKLLAFIPQAGPHLYTGPMLMDNFQGVCTHFNPQWRSEMYGTWGRAWQCPCGLTNFSLVERDALTEGYLMPHCTERFRQCSCGRELPELAWAGHEAALLADGYKALGSSPEDEPFEIPGQGLGLFGCRKDAWLQFHPHAIGFGAEELNIHELYFQRGHKAISQPFLTWLHKFGRPNGVPYPLQRYHKVRNYVLWHLRLGKPLTDIHEHFVATRLMSPEHWDYLIADPVNHVEPPGGCNSCGKKAAAPLPASIEEAYQNTLVVERDFNQHMPKLRELADNCAHVTDISIRHESFIALAASKAQVVVSYSNEHNPLTDHVSKMRSMNRLPIQPQNVSQINKTELLFLNTTHTADQVYKELSTLGIHSTHYIVLHNTHIYGEQGENINGNQTAGILPAARRFMREHPEWCVIHHDNKQYGLTVLSCLAADKKHKPGLFTQIANFTKASAEHIADGATKVSTADYEDRLDVCAGCDQRVDGDCSVCGCALSIKAAWRSSDCPLGRWPGLTVLQ